jgi:signal transduction histidine kinase
MLTTSIIALSALTAFANGDYVLKTVILFATKVLYFLLGSLFLSLLKKNKTKLSIPERGFMLIIFIATFISLLTMWNVEWELSFKLGIKNSLLASIMSICLLIISILLYFLFVRISKNNAEREKLRLLNLKNSTELKIYDEISVQYNKLNCIRHDLKHHASLIKDNLDAGNVPEIYKYLSDLDNELSETCTIYTKNSIVDLVLNSKFLSAKNKGITPYYDINITNLEKITKHANQIGIVLGNLLDNAITATLPSGEIKLSIFNRRNFLVIVLENSIKPNSITDIKKLETTNPDKENHGFGLISVRNTVEKLNGSLNISIDNDSFLVEIVI